MNSNRRATTSCSDESSFRTRYSREDETEEWIRNSQASLGSSDNTDGLQGQQHLHHSSSGRTLSTATNAASATMIASAAGNGVRFKPYPHFSELPDDLALENCAASLFESNSNSSRGIIACRDTQYVPTTGYHYGRRDAMRDQMQPRWDSISPSQRSRSEVCSNYFAMPLSTTRRATTTYNNDRAREYKRSTSSSISSDPSLLDRLLRTPPRTQSSNSNTCHSSTNRIQQERQQARLMEGRNNHINSANASMHTTSATSVAPPLAFPSNLTVSSAFARQRSIQFGSSGTMNVAADRNRDMREVPSPEHDEDNDHEERFYRDRIRPTTTQSRSSSSSKNGPPLNITILPSHPHGLYPSPLDEEVADYADKLDNLYPKGARSNTKSSSSFSSSCVDDGKPPAKSVKDKTAPRYPTTMVEISPGISVPLRGAVETLDSVRIDFYAPCTCMVCDVSSIDQASNRSPMFCIQDAAYVLCPVCKSISPLADHQGYGVGLGFTLDVLAEMQEQIYRERTPCPVARLAQPTDEDDYS